MISESDVLAAPNHGPDEESPMQTAKTLNGKAQTYLTHMFGRGLDGDRHVIERFQSMADGEIRPRRCNGSSKKGRGNGPRKTVSLQAVQQMRPERDEIIICTGVNCTTLGVQYWVIERRACSERQVPLTGDPRGRPARLRRTDVLRQDNNRGREKHAIQRSRDRTRVRAAAL